MAEPRAAVAHQFDDAEQQRSAASLGMWTFLAQEILFFGGAFCVYVVYRSLYPESFAHASHHLDVRLGTFNTAVLIASSLTMALAVHAAQTSRRGRTIAAWLVATLGLGSVFLVVKGYEYAHKFHEHLVPGPSFSFPGTDAPRAQLFFSLYFALTGLHALHMVIGIGLLVWLIRGALRERFDASYYAPVENMGLYWHFVDIVWVFLFPLLYLIGRHGS